MKNLLNVTKGITHAGKFHTDDVLSAVLIKRLNPNIEIIRVNEYEADDSIEDILAFDIGLGEFDHHQEDRELDDYGYAYSAFGKLWRAYGKELLKQYGFTKLDEAYKLFNKKYVVKVDEGDNYGYKNVKFFFENDMIVRFNPNWYETKYNPGIADEQFAKAVEFADMLFENWLRAIYEAVELYDAEEEIWSKAVSEGEDGIIILDEKIPWQVLKKRHKHDDVKIIIARSERGGYSICSTNLNEYQILNSKYLKFLHPSGFMGTSETLDYAIRAAEESISYCLK